MMKRWEASGTVSAGDSWTSIAVEGLSFLVNATQSARYGSGASWIARSVTDGGWCANDWFGNDPIVGVVKQCEAAAP